MPVRVASLYGVLSLDDRKFRDGMQRSRQEMVGLSGTMRGMVDNVRAAGQAALVGIGALAAGAGLAGKALFDMGKSAAVFQGIEEAFQGMVESTGKGSREMLRSLQNASAGMASNEDLMLSYNKAAQLVSTTFANQLPDAMDELTKVASATGQDMGFLMDSLVVGIGRLSPMILDNLGIQVSLTEAYEEYAKTVGKSADTLTKSEQQAALTAQVMKKLEQNTAALPSVLGQSDTKMAQFEARMENLRIAVGKHVMPAFDGIITGANAIGAALEYIVTGDYTKAIGDALGGIFQNANEDSPVVEAIGQIRDMIPALMAGVPVFDLLANALAEIASDAARYDDLPLVGFLSQLLGFTLEVLKPIGDWISANFKLQDILLALGIVIGSVVLPVLASIIAAVAPVILGFMGLVGLIAAVRQAWETDFLGIRTAVETIIEAINGFLEKINDGVPPFVAFWETLVDLGGVDFANIASGIALVTGAVLLATAGVKLATLAAKGFGLIMGLILTPAGLLALAIGAILVAANSLYPGGLVQLFKDAKTSAEQLGQIINRTLLPPLREAAEILREFLANISSLGPQLNFSGAGGASQDIALPFTGNVPFDLLRLFSSILPPMGGGQTMPYSEYMAQQKDSGGLGMAGMPYVIGKPQVGNELFIPSTNGTFVPDFAKMMAAGGGGGDQSISIVINTNDPMVMKEKVLEVLQEARRRR